MNTATVIEALQRNFGGMPQEEFQDIARRFVRHLAKACGRIKFPEPQPDNFRPTLEVLADALAEGSNTVLDQHATLSDRSARPKLIIDYTGVPSCNCLRWCSARLSSRQTCSKRNVP